MGIYPTFEDGTTRIVLHDVRGSMSMLRQRTRAALAVFSFPGAEPRQVMFLDDQGGPGVGFPHVRCLLADQ